MEIDVIAYVRTHTIVYIYMFFWSVQNWNISIKDVGALCRFVESDYVRPEATAEPVERRWKTWVTQIYCVS